MTATSMLESAQITSIEQMHPDSPWRISTCLNAQAWAAQPGRARIIGHDDTQEIRGLTLAVAGTPGAPSIQQVASYLRGYPSDAQWTLGKGNGYQCSLLVVLLDKRNTIVGAASGALAVRMQLSRSGKAQIIRRFGMIRVAPKQRGRGHATFLVHALENIFSDLEDAVWSTQRALHCTVTASWPDEMAPADRLARLAPSASWSNRPRGQPWVVEVDPDASVPDDLEGPLFARPAGMVNPQPSSICSVAERRIFGSSPIGPGSALIRNIKWIPDHDCNADEMRVRRHVTEVLVGGVVRAQIVWSEFDGDPFEMTQPDEFLEALDAAGD